MPSVRNRSAAIRDVYRSRFPSVIVPNQQPYPSRPWGRRECERPGKAMLPHDCVVILVSEAHVGRLLQILNWRPIFVQGTCRHDNGEFAPICRGRKAQEPRVNREEVFDLLGVIRWNRLRHQQNRSGREQVATCGFLQFRLQAFYVFPFWRRRGTGVVALAERKMNARFVRLHHDLTKFSVPTGIVSTRASPASLLNGVTVEGFLMSGQLLEVTGWMCVFPAGTLCVSGMPGPAMPRCGMSQAQKSFPVGSRRSASPSAGQKSRQNASRGRGCFAALRQRQRRDESSATNPYSLTRGDDAQRLAGNQRPPPNRGDYLC